MQSTICMPCCPGAVVSTDTVVPVATPHGRRLEDAELALRHRVRGTDLADDPGTHVGALEAIPQLSNR